MPDEVTRPSHLFIVRAWHEPGRTPGEGQWRGSVEHLPSGQRRYFIALDELARLMMAQLGQAGWDTGPRQSAASQEPGTAGSTAGGGDECAGTL